MKLINPISNKDPPVENQPGYYDADTNELVLGDKPLMCTDDLVANREFVCFNSNDCRWRCVNAPNDPFYGNQFWETHPYVANDGHMQFDYQPYYSGDMICPKVEFLKTMFE